MNASREKKQRERRLGEIFFQLSGVSAEIAEERESPDFLLSVEGRHVGLELTEIYVPGDRNAMPAKASESLAAKLVNEARHRYEVQGGKPLHVSVGFVPNTDFRAINRTQTARVLAEFLLKQEVSMDSVRWSKPIGDNPLPREIHFLHAFPVQSQAAAHWDVPQAGWIVPLTDEILQTSVDAKAGKLVQYQNAALEAWLLLVVAGGAPSQGFDRNPDIRWEAIRSPYARTYFLSVMDGTVQRLGGLK